MHHEYCKSIRDILDVRRADYPSFFRSWHITYSIVHLPAWIIVSLIWHFRIFTATSGVLVLVVHVLCGYGFILAQSRVEIDDLDTF